MLSGNRLKTALESKAEHLKPNIEDITFNSVKKLRGQIHRVVLS